VNDTIARRTDGYIYAVIVSGQVMGRGLMPVYGDKVRGTDRWDVVNYIRTLQAQARSGGTRLARPSRAPAGSSSRKPASFPRARFSRPESSRRRSGPRS